MRDRHDDPPPGTNLVSLTVATTGLVVVMSALAAASPTRFGTAYAMLSGLLFAVGTAGLLWAYALGVTRSRADDVSIPGLFFLGGGTAPPAIRRSFRVALLVEVVAVVVAASIRPYTAVAFGILAPMFAMGLMATWGARHGTFPPRPAPGGGAGARRSTVEDGGA